jgi:hypothetical protein
MLHEAYDEDCEPDPAGSITLERFRVSDPYSKELIQKARDALGLLTQDIEDLDSVVSSLRVTLSVPHHFLKTDAPYVRGGPSFLLASE